MAKNDNLKDFLTDVADAIREKKGTSEPINAQDFSAEIASIETGGDGGAIEYWAVGDSNFNVFVIFGMFMSLMKFTYDNALFITSTGSAIGFGEDATLVAFAVDMNAKVLVPTINPAVITTREALSYIGIPEGGFAEKGCTPLTEEEFYSIN